MGKINLCFILHFNLIVITICWSLGHIYFPKSRRGVSSFRIEFTPMLGTFIHFFSDHFFVTFESYWIKLKANLCWIKNKIQKYKKKIDLHHYTFYNSIQVVCFYLLFYDLTVFLLICHCYENQMIWNKIKIFLEKIRLILFYYFK